MKKYGLILAFCLIPLTAYAAVTTHFNFNLPTVGGSTNQWGTLLNSNFTNVDTNLWNISGGLNVSVHSQSSATNITLTNQLASFQSITFTAASQKLILSAMNATNSMTVGGTISVYNAGSNAFSIYKQDGVTSIYSGLAAGQVVYLTLSNNSTANGTFTVTGPYISSVGTLALGTSTTSANPSVSGDLATGFYTPSAAALAATITGSQRWLLNSSGQTVTGNSSTTGAFNLTTTSAAGGSLNGLHSPTANALALETNGSDALFVTSSQSVGIGTSAPGAKLGVAGALNFTATVAASAGQTGLLSNAANTLEMVTTGSVGIKQFADGGVTVGSPTGASQGAGTINVTGCYVNGVACGGGGSSSITQNGYQTFASGLIIQWGYVTPGSTSANPVVFPTAFPNSCFSVTVTTAGVSDGKRSAGISSTCTTSGFSFYTGEGSAGNEAFPVYWMATGN